MQWPLEYQETKDPRLRGGMVVNMSEAGALIESIKSIPLNAQLNIAVLFPDGFELADLKLAARVVRQQSISKDEWNGYQYGLSIIHVWDDDQWIRKLIFNGRGSMKDFEIFNGIMTGFKTDLWKIRNKGGVVLGSF